MMRSKKTVHEWADLKQAEGLLRDKNLDWSADFEAIRLDLADLMKYAAVTPDRIDPIVLNIARTLIATENTLTI